MSHIVLLGDSIFDNAAYVRGGPDVVTHLRGTLPAGWTATLAAVDGAVASGVEHQLRAVPEDADFLVVSAGGNDALGEAGILDERVRSVPEALDRLAGVAEAFEDRYRRMLRGVLERGLPTGVCTVYYPSYTDPAMQRVLVAALTVFNDAILRAAFGAGLPLVDLRLVFDDPVDYANPIEPSVQGGAKIARAVARLVTEHDFERGRTQVYV